jgi:AraC-like DNA-binding protein
MQLRLLESDVTDAGAPRRRVGPAHIQARMAPAPGTADGLRFWRPLPRQVIDLVCADGAVTGVPLHTHEALQVMLPASPAVVVEATGRATTVYPGQIHLTSPLELYAVRSIDRAPVGIRMMLLGPALLAKLGATGGTGERATSPRLAQRVVDDPGLYSELAALLDVLRGPLVDLGCESQLLGCFTRLFGRAMERHLAAAALGARDLRGVARARDHLRAHPADNVSLDELADVAGLSKFYLLRAFRRAYGLTPHEYQMQLRLARARRLLAEGRPLSHVTYDAGFADQSHLTRRFKAFFDLTPARYARQVATPMSAVPRRASDAYRAAAPVPAA